MKYIYLYLFALAWAPVFSQSGDEEAIMEPIVRLFTGM